LSEVGEKAEHIRCELCGGVVAGVPLCGPCRERLSAPLHEAGLIDAEPAAEPAGAAATGPRARRRPGIAPGWAPGPVKDPPPGAWRLQSILRRRPRQLRYVEYRHGRVHRLSRFSLAMHPPGGGSHGDPQPQTTSMTGP